MMLLASVLLWAAGIIAIIALVHRIRWMIATMIIVNKIPGPPTYPIIGNFLDFYDSCEGFRYIASFLEKVWILSRNWAKKYHPIYRVWGGSLAMINLLCPEDIEILLSSPKYITKGIIYRFLEPWLGKGLLTSSGSKWQSRRKILTPTFHFSILQQFLPIITEQSKLLVDRLQEECHQSHTEIVPIITKFTLHSICETAMGTHLHEAVENQKLYVQSIYRAILRERKRSFQDKNFSRKSEGETFSKRRLAMLELLISAQKAGANIDDEGIREEVDTFIFEGHDTTAMSICFTLLLLANHPDVQDKVVKELQEIFGDSDRHPVYQDLQNMRYLETVLKESLRMYPSVPVIARILEKDVRTHSGYVLPAGVSIHVSIYDLHHNPKIYHEPEKFDPDRFLPENTKKRHPFAYLPFSAGPRNCIGQKFAMLELKTVMSAILRQFFVEPIDAPADIVLSTDIVIRPKYGIKVKFAPRRSFTK